MWLGAQLLGIDVYGLGLEKGAVMIRWYGYLGPGYRLNIGYMETDTIS